ncbi:MAG: lamin tail domain-containing protein [Patescibacteria group bacterium]
MFRRLMGRLCLLALSCSALDPFAPLAHADTLHALHIGEVAWAGSTLSTADEWLELWNTSGAPLSLAGYRLEGASASPIIFDSTSTVPAYGTFLIANYDASDVKSTLATDTQLVTTAVSLSNSSLHLALYAPDNALIDEVPLGAPPAGSSSPKASMIRSTTSTTWYTATTTLFLKPGTADFGTPGYCDGCIVPTDEPAAEIPATTTTEPVLDPDPEAELEDATIVEETSTSTDIAVSETTTTEITTTDVTTVEATDTEPVIIETTTADEVAPIPDPEPVIEPEPIPAPEPTLIPAPTITPTPIQTAIVPQTPPPSLKLQAVFPAPDNAKEWVDVIWTNDTHDLARLDGWSLQNGRNKTIFRFSTSTRPTLVEHDGLIRVTFKSAVLLNAGDTISLFDATGALVDRMSYDKTPKGSTWTLDGTWQNPDLLPKATATTSTIMTPVPASTATQTATAKTSVTTKKEAVKTPAKEKSHQNCNKNYWHQK